MSKDVDMKHKSFARKNLVSVAGVVAPGPHPTLLAAALVATAISFIFLTVAGVADLIF